MEWIVPLLVALATGVAVVLKSIFGTDKPTETKVEHPKPDLEVNDGKTDAERLDDLGL